MPPKRKPLSAKERQYVIIEVGPRCREYKVRKTLLMKHSEFFRKALQGTWKEATDGKVVLEDVKPAIFEIFVEWLYTGKVPKKKEIDDESSDGEDDHDEAENAENEDQDDDNSDYEDIFCEDKEPCNDCIGCTETYVTSLVKAYTLGDRFLAPLYKHAMLDQLIEHMYDYIEPTWFRAIAYAYNNLPENDPMLRALIDIHCRYWTALVGVELSKEKKEQAELLPTDFWLWTSTVSADMRVEYSYHQPAFWNRPLNPCDYHYHHQDDSEEGKECKERWKAKMQEIRTESPWLFRKPISWRTIVDEEGDS